MSAVCQVTGKKVMSGNHVSHARNHVKRRFLPNLHKRRFYVPTKNQWVSLLVSAKGIRIINKLGIEAVLAKIAAQKSSPAGDSHA